ncbi:MAG TPA: protein translocase subunit SecD [Pirellulales bacterium]
MSSLHSIVALLGQALPPQAPATPWYQDTWFNLLVALAVITVPFLIGQWLAKRLRMEDYATRIGIVVFALVAGIVVCVAGWPPKRGIDLSGGVIMVYEVDASKATSVDVKGMADQVQTDLTNAGFETKVTALTDRNQIEITLPGANPAETTKVEEQLRKTNGANTELTVEARPIRDGKQVLVVGVKKSNSIDMEKMISAISKRVNPGGQKEVTIRRMGSDRVEVIIPQAEQTEVDVVKDKISTAGALQFRILANTGDPQMERIIDLAKQTEGHDVKEKDDEGKEVVVAQWVQMDPDQYPDPATSASQDKSVIRTTKKGETECLVITTPFDVGGGNLANASVGHDELGGPAVNFSFDARGANLFAELTKSHLPDESGTKKYFLGIILDGKLKSSPYIKSIISSSGEISGHYTPDSAQFLVDILNAGSLPAALSKIPVSEYSVSAQLGNDTIKAGAYSMIFGTLAVLIFMQIYYRFAGFVANLAVVVNLILIMAVMILIKAHLTLAGLAGLVLSVGMAVDANVLIYERMREEQERGAALRMAIRNGFARAMRTIIDSHCTTLITGIVLFAIGTDQLRGFATTLVLGLLLNLFTAVYCSRIIFDIAERQRWLTKLNMMHIFGKTNIDFVKSMPYWMTLSVSLIVIGIVASVARETGYGANLFGIDFTGGTAVQVVFNKSTDVAKVREAVEGKLRDVSVSLVASAEGEERDTRFNIDTSDRGETTDAGKAPAGDGNTSVKAIEAVEGKIKDIFKGQLKMYQLEVVSLGPAPVESSEIKPAEPPAIEKTPGDPKGKSTEHTALADDATDAKAEVKATAADAKDEAKDAAKDAVKDEAKAAAEPAPAEKSKADKSGAEKSAAEKSTTEKSTGEKSAAAQAVVSAPTGAVDANNTLAKLHFADGINYTALDANLHLARDNLMLPETSFDISSPDKEFTPGSGISVKDWDVRISLPQDQAAKLLDAVKQKLADTPVFPTASTIGGKVAGDTKVTAYYALAVSTLLVAIYIWIRFQNLVFGLAAVVALFHDVFIATGALAVSYWLAVPFGFLLVDPFKISLEVVAALLTIVGYSINDTIVVFDRIREIRGKSPDLTPQMINSAINQTLSRTILTSGTVFLVTGILYAFGGEGVHAFAFSMLIGVITGTFSSVFIAAPILLWFKKPSASPTGARTSTLSSQMRATRSA